MPTILIDPADFDSIISSLGVTLQDFTYADIQSKGFLEAAEAFITKRINAQAGIGVSVPTVAQIMTNPPTSPAVPADRVFLQAAAIYRVAQLFGPGETNSVDVSQSIGPVNRDLGGLGETWLKQMDKFEAFCDQALGSITGFKRWRTL
jgi:hypothetical protein